MQVKMDRDLIIDEIGQGRTALGIEFGTTRIKAVLINQLHEPIAIGSYIWENQLVNGIWTYSIDEIWNGLQQSFQELTNDVREKYGVQLKSVGSIGISAMMHGYMPFDEFDNLLVPFRTWRNIITEEASERLTELFEFNIPQRWSIAHLFQAILNKEPHVGSIRYITTLAGYVHWKLTGQKALGIGEASGVLPIDNETCDYDSEMIEKFGKLIESYNFDWKLREILPEVIAVDQTAGKLSVEGAKLIDPNGNLQPGIPFCPPEGDAITGIIATNSVSDRSGNVSAGTSVFLMVVLEKPLSQPYQEVDVLTVPNGKPVVMIHSNNCTSDLNAWVGLFDEFSKLVGVDLDQDELFGLLYHQALMGDFDGGGLLAYNAVSGEHLLHLEEGRPLFVRESKSKLNLANFFRTHLFASLGALKMGLDKVFEKEKIEIDRMFGHGGFFKTDEVGQRIMAAALNVPVSIMETAGEGGAWGMAILAGYSRFREENQTIDIYLSEQVFGGQKTVTIEPHSKDLKGFDKFMARYQKALVLERTAVQVVD